MKINPANMDVTELRNPQTEYERDISERKPCFTVIMGDLIGQIFKLNSDVTVIGRGSDADLIFALPSVSRRHAMIVRRRDKYLISDLESTNGTLVNRERVVHPMVLFEGDKVTIGELTFKFSFQDRDDTQYQQQLRNMAVTDGLTNIFNKRYFMDVVRREFEYSRRRKDRLSLIFFDLDHFKLLNDTYGHEAGDFVLSELASMINVNAREYDLFARYGGEEFVILLRGIELEEVVSLAERIRKMVETNVFHFGGEEITITLSMGVAVFEGDDKYDSPGQFIEAADKQLYRAKQNGRNQVCY